MNGKPWIMVIIGELIRNVASFVIQKKAYRMDKLTIRSDDDRVKIDIITPDNYDKLPKVVQDAICGTIKKNANILAGTIMFTPLWSLLSDHLNTFQTAFSMMNDLTKGQDGGTINHEHPDPG